MTFFHCVKGFLYSQAFDLMPCIVIRVRVFFVVFCFLLSLLWPFLSVSFHVDQVFERADDG